MKPKLAIGLAFVLAQLATPTLASAPRIDPERVGRKWGRCLLVVDGERRIDGGCYYQIYAGGDFHIDGPRQVFRGVDYGAGSSHDQSDDYWFNVFRYEGGWSGYGNANIISTHGEGPTWENLQREGACLFNRWVRICLWRE